MKGYQLVLTWIIFYILICFPFFRHFSLFNRLVAYWCTVMLCVSIFEAMLIFKWKYMCKKGKKYYKKNKCYWNEDVKLKDACSSKMYMDLYADYSLADCKYRRGFGKEGFHFVFFGEIYHGIFSGILSGLTLWKLFTDPDSSAYKLLYFTLGIVQLTMITWYVSPCILELFYENCGNHISKWWWPPFLWNLPWFIVPPILIWKSVKTLV